MYKNGDVTLSSVEGWSAEACPPWFDGAHHDSLFEQLSFDGLLPSRGELNILYIPRLISRREFSLGLHVNPVFDGLILITNLLSII